AYAASKGALIPFAKSLAAEVAQYRIRVNTVFPGVIDTPQFRAANPSGGEREHWAATTGIGEPEDVVGPLLFLLSDAATMTGSTKSGNSTGPPTLPRSACAPAISLRTLVFPLSSTFRSTSSSPWCGPRSRRRLPASSTWDTG